jgi:hypothetical protein
MAPDDKILEFLLEVYRVAEGSSRAEVDGMAAADALFTPGEAFVATKRTLLEKCEQLGWITVHRNKKHVKLTQRGIDRAKRHLSQPASPPPGAEQGDS